LLFGPAQVVDNTEKKKHACRYVNIDTADLWEAIPEFDVTKTFDEFKSAIFKLYPSSESERKWTIASSTPPTQQASPYVKAEDLLMLFKQMAQSFLKVLAPQKSMTNTASSSTNAQATTSLDLLSCAFCGQSGHFIAQCLICADYITNEKCKRNLEGNIVLPNGQFTLCSIPGWFIKD
jgi:hypothetical protein